MKYLKIFTKVLTIIFVVNISTIAISQNQVNGNTAKLNKTQKIPILKGFITIAPTFNSYKFNTDSSNTRTKESGIIN